MLLIKQSRLRTPCFDQKLLKLKYSYRSRHVTYLLITLMRYYHQRPLLLCRTWKARYIYHTVRPLWLPIGRVAQIRKLVFCLFVLNRKLFGFSFGVFHQWQHVISDIADFSQVVTQPFHIHSTRLTYNSNGSYSGVQMLSTERLCDITYYTTRTNSIRSRF